jgi:hypothetical protein
MAPIIDNQVESRITHKHRHRQRQRKTRYTFPNELDDNVSIHLSRDSLLSRYPPIRRHSMSSANIDEEYDNNAFFNQREESSYEKRFIITKTVEGVKKEMFIKKYTKIHPTTHTIQEQDPVQEHEDVVVKTISNKPAKILNTLSKMVMKIVYYIGIISCIAI